MCASCSCFYFLLRPCDLPDDSYPPLLHLKLRHLSTRAIALDWAMVGFGIIAASYTTYQTLSLMIAAA
jgi:hypothetical protein